MIPAADLAALDATDAFVNLQFLFQFDLPFLVADGSWLRFRAEKKGDGVQLKPIEQEAVDEVLPGPPAGARPLPLDLA